LSRQNIGLSMIPGLFIVLEEKVISIIIQPIQIYFELFVNK